MVLFTRQDYGFWELVAEDETDLDWVEFVFPEAVTKIRVFNVGSFVHQPVMEVEIDGIDGSFLLAMTNEFDLDNHVLNAGDKIRCRLHEFPFVPSVSNMYASVLGLAKREKEEGEIE